MIISLICYWIMKAFNRFYVFMFKIAFHLMPHLLLFIINLLLIEFIYFLNQHLFVSSLIGFCNLIKLLTVSFDHLKSGLASILIFYVCNFIMSYSNRFHLFCCLRYLESTLFCCLVIISTCWIVIIMKLISCLIS